jgi:hypothetical protein
MVYSQNQLKLKIAEVNNQIKAVLNVLQSVHINDCINLHYFQTTIKPKITTVDLEEVKDQVHQTREVLDSLDKLFSLEEVRRNYLRQLKRMTKNIPNQLVNLQDQIRDFNIQDPWIISPPRYEARTNTVNNPPTGSQNTSGSTNSVSNINNPPPYTETTGSSTNSASGVNNPLNPLYWNKQLKSNAFNWPQNSTSSLMPSNSGQSSSVKNNNLNPEDKNQDSDSDSENEPMNQ